MNTDAYPMHCAPRCTARSKRSGEPCRNPAVRGWSVCRMHGARGGAKPGCEHPNFIHGERCQDAVSLRALSNALVREARDLCDKLEIE